MRDMRYPVGVPPLSRKQAAGASTELLLAKQPVSIEGDGVKRSGMKIRAT